MLIGGDTLSYLALYRKYRPFNLNDLVGQDYVSKIIKDEILNNKISHAYLFSGPRGTGKTSTAKIIAKMINCLDLSDDGVPCGKCINCLNTNNSDIVEIDAASNNGVDEIRELRDKVNLVPTTGKYKIYIIDEVHMLTNQAFNALLKTLEEPPAHIIFILATTEFNKIPITVVSRCQKFRFNKFSINEIVDRLKKIVLEENLSISDDVLFEIARLSDGGLRDAINMLDQLSSYKDNDISVDDVYNLNGVVSYDEFNKLLINIIDGDYVNVMNFIQELDKNGNSLVRFLEDFMLFLKDIFLYLKTSNCDDSSSINKKIIISSSKLLSLSVIYDLIFQINDLIVKIKNSSCPTILIISFFINYSINLNKNNVVEEKANNNLVKNDIIEEKVEKKKKTDDIEIDSNVRKIRINNTFATASKKYKDDITSNWNLINDKLVDSRYGSVAALLNDTEVLVVGDGYLMMLAKYDSLLRRLYNKIDIIEDLVSSAFNKSYRIVFLTNDEWLYEKQKYIDNLKNDVKYKVIEEDIKIKNKDNDIDVSTSSDDIEKIISIFGNDVIEYK